MPEHSKNFRQTVWREIEIIRPLFAEQPGADPLRQHARQHRVMPDKVVVERRRDMQNDHQPGHPPKRSFVFISCMTHPMFMPCHKCFTASYSLGFVQKQNRKDQNFAVDLNQ